MIRGLERGSAAALAIVVEALSWRGTPFVWGQSVKQRGCDCKGLVAGVARELGRPEAASVHALAVDYRLVDPLRLRAGLADTFDRAGVIGAGDVLLLKFGGKAQHLAIVTDRDTVVHCTTRAEKRGVHEQSLDAVLGIWPLDSIWRWKVL